MASALEERLDALVRGVLGELGFDLIRVRYQGNCLEVMAEPNDKNVAMRVEDCALISRKISVLLDEADPIAAEYRLEVTSPGLARPLVRREDYRRFAGEMVKITCSALIDGRRRFHGRLLGLSDADKIDIDTSFGRVSLDYGVVEAATLDPSAMMERRHKSTHKSMEKG